MRHRAISTLALLVLVVAMATPAADAARPLRYSGTVTAIDPQGSVMMIDEVGPWQVERGTTVVTPRTITLTDSTKYNLFMRANIPGEYAGDFIEVLLDATDISAGDVVTAECVRQGDKLVALTVTVAELD
jgi:hypothetical protein